MQKRRGFTFIEGLTAFVILGILAAIIIPSLLQKKTEPQPAPEIKKTPPGQVTLIGRGQIIERVELKDGRMLPLAKIRLDQAGDPLIAILSPSDQSPSECVQVYNCYIYIGKDDRFYLATPCAFSLDTQPAEKETPR